jgi:hypothetical protein
MAVLTDHELGLRGFSKALLVAQGIDPRTVRSYTIDCDVNEAAMMTVRVYINDAAAELLRSIDR